TSMWGTEPRIRALLINRFLIATLRCIQLEFELLAIFLLCLQSDSGNPCIYIKAIAGWLLWSWYTLFHMIGLVFNAALYGVLMCRKHQQAPIRCTQWKAFLQREFVFRLAVLVALLGVCYHSSCFYIGYVDRMGVDFDVRSTKSFLVISSTFCTGYYFVTEHLALNKELWRTPLLQKRMTIFYGLPQSHQVEHIMQANIMPSLMAAVLCWPNMGRNYRATGQLLGLFCCLTTLITAQLHEIRNIYASTMQSRLPMTLLTELKQQLNEQELPLILGLETITPHGFQMLVARDFYELMINRRSKECNNLYQLSGFTRQLPKDWHMVRDILLDRITAFTQRLEQCLSINQAEPVLIEESYLRHHMRSLLNESPKPARYWSRRGVNCAPQVQQPLPVRNRRWLRNLWHEKMMKLEEGCCKYIVRAVEYCCVQDDLLFEISCSESITWLLQGFVEVCVRSLDEDKYGTIHGDLEQIFQTIVDLKRTLCVAKKTNADIRIKVFWQMTSSSLAKMLYYFKEYLEFIVRNDELLEHLQRLAQSN
ncbi:hypothetical protein KR093_001397, partial [Drosophila rubida]